MQGLGEEEQAEKGLPRSGQIQPQSPPASGLRMACPPHSRPVHSRVSESPGRHCNARVGGS